MANTLLTPTMVTRKSLQVLHQKLNFIGSINRQYDDSFAKTGAKIGDSLKIRLPNRYTVTDGAVMQVQDTAETSVTLQVATQKHVAMNFGAAELALSMDDFTDRIIEPAMAVLASVVEADALSMYKLVNQQAGAPGSALTLANIMAGEKKLTDSLAPTGKRTALLCTQGNVDLVDALKGQFNPNANISEMYREGLMGQAVGFDFMRTSLLMKHTSGTEIGGSETITVSGATQTGASVTVTNGSSKTLNKGDIVSFVGVNRVHPETKQDTGVLHQFVVTADVTSSGTSIPISPSIITSGASQNCSASSTDSQAIKKVGTASQQYDINLEYHRDAFAFATADLPLPKGAEFADRQQYDGISLRIWKDRDILNDSFPCRVDILYGYQAIRTQLASRVAAN